MDEKIRIIKGVAAGILHLTNNRIVHRDLAARNILLASGMQPKVSDFGMSRLLGEKEEAKNTNSTVGPVRWMAPENLKDLQYSYASDVWSLASSVGKSSQKRLPLTESLCLMLRSRSAMKR
jgi:serine/threonine protein kinase